MSGVYGLPQPNLVLVRRGHSGGLLGHQAALYRNGTLVWNGYPLDLVAAILSSAGVGYEVRDTARPLLERPDRSLAVELGVQERNAS